MKRGGPQSESIAISALTLILFDEHAYDWRIGQMICCHGELATGEGSISGAHCDSGGEAVLLSKHGLLAVVPVVDLLCGR